MTRVDVWRRLLTPDPEAELAARRVLTADEQRAADKFRDPLDRAAHVHARALLRTVLARFHGDDPQAVELVATVDGKPVLTDPAGARFSVSHSRALVVVATCASTAIGVDVEPRREVAWREVAARFFAPAERAAIDRRRDGDRIDAFFAIWVRKEAYLKGIGLGFTDTSNDFEVPLDDGFVHDPARATTRWYLHGLDLDTGHAAALAVAGGRATIAVHDG